MISITRLSTRQTNQNTDENYYISPLHIFKLLSITTTKRLKWKLIWCVCVWRFCVPLLFNLFNKSKNYTKPPVLILKQSASCLLNGSLQYFLHRINTKQCDISHIQDYSTSFKRQMGDGKIPDVSSISCRASSIQILNIHCAPANF